MNNDDIKKLVDLVDERINKALEPIKQQLGSRDANLKMISQQLDDPDTGLKRIVKKLDANTESIVTIEKEVKSYADSYKENQRNIKRLDTRLNVVEEELAIEPPEDLKVPHFV